MDFKFIPTTLSNFRANAAMDRTILSWDNISVATPLTALTVVGSNIGLSAPI